METRRQAEQTLHSSVASALPEIHNIFYHLLLDHFFLLVGFQKKKKAKITISKKFRKRAHLRRVSIVYVRLIF